MQTIQRIGVLLAALMLAAIPSGGASASLKKFQLIVRNQSNDPNVTPNPNVTISQSLVEDSVARVDAAEGPNPVLRRLVRAIHQANTTNVPSLTTQIFVSLTQRDGPDVLDQIRGNPVAAFTGTGGTGTTIRWGIVTGWTISAAVWCNSNPAVICSLAMFQDEQTVDGRFNSEFYDLGTWFFHSTGFTASPFIASYTTQNFGNTTLWIRGFNAPDSTVPALPLLGLAVLGGSLVAGGVSALYRQRSR